MCNLDRHLIWLKILWAATDFDKTDMFSINDITEIISETSHPSGGYHMIGRIAYWDPNNTKYNKQFEIGATVTLKDTTNPIISINRLEIK